MEYKEDEYLHLAGIQHFLFCRRQWALIHIEQQWQENILTAEGNILHEKAHDGYSSEKRKNVIVTRGMPIRSTELGISGVCDIVEFHLDKHGVPIHGREGKYKIYPVEYKRGKPKSDDMDELQVVTQAMCLEEMFCCQIDKAWLYYGEIRRRIEIQINDSMKEKCRNVFHEMHQIYARKYTPKVKTGKHCRACSLNEVCLPELEKRKKVSIYMKQHIEENEL